MKVAFHLDTTPLRPLWQKVPKALKKPLLGRLGKRGEVELRTHFRERDREPNKRGWPRQHFWARLRRVTALSSWNDHQAIITVADPAMAAKIHGAVIRPVEAKALAIPIHRRAYGIRPSSGLIPGLFVLQTKKGAYLAAGRDEFRGRKRSGIKRQRLTLYYKLVKSTTVPADPRALPARTAWLTALQREAERFIERQIQGN